MQFYAAINTYADLRNGNHGFLNTWQIARFDTRQARDAWVNENENRLAKPVTRKEAESIWRGTYICVGEPVPQGGLFCTDKFGDSRFYEPVPVEC